MKEVEDCLVRQFAAMAQRDGKARLHDLGRYLGLPQTEHTLVKLFNLYDEVT